MGVGYATDLVVCVALGVDMFDCVFPTRLSEFSLRLTSMTIHFATRSDLHIYFPLSYLHARTARFGVALTSSGSLQLKNGQFSDDFSPIEAGCPCATCQTLTRAFLHTIVRRESVACQHLSIHNVTYQLRLMRSVREAIVKDEFPAFIRTFMRNMYEKENYPRWAVDALAAVGVDLPLTGQ